MAMDYAESLDIYIAKNVSVYQIPHHGGRHNITPKLLNRLIGKVVAENLTTGKTGIVSAAKESDHPKKMVVNAFIRREVKVYETKGGSFQYRHGFPLHEGWGIAQSLSFSKEIEPWND